MPPVAIRLRRAIEEQKISQRQLARGLAGADATTSRVENERRQIMKWLAGDHLPSEAKARRLSELLEKPADYFIDAVGQARRLPELVAEVHELIGDVSELIDEQLGAKAVTGPPWAVTLHDRLQSLEGAVSSAGQAATDAITRLEAAIVRLSQQLEPQGQQDQEAAR